MKYPARLSLIVAVFGFGVLSLAAAQDSQAPETPAQLHVEQAAPIENAVLFVSPKMGGKSVGFFRAPDGTAVVVPVNEIKQAFEAGYRPVTVGDLLEGIDSYTKMVQEQQKRLNDLTSDYNVLAERFNRLAAVNSTAPVPAYTPSQTNDEKRAMRLMLFQSLLSRTAPAPPPTRIQVTDCTAYPALCVH